MEIHSRAVHLTQSHSNRLLALLETQRMRSSPLHTQHKPPTLHQLPATEVWDILTSQSLFTFVDLNINYWNGPRTVVNKCSLALVSILLSIINSIKSKHFSSGSQFLIPCSFECLTWGTFKGVDFQQMLNPYSLENQGLFGCLKLWCGNKEIAVSW